VRINDGSICADCKHFDHECDSEWGCAENCYHTDEKVKELFVDDYDYEKVISECKGYEKN